MERKMIQILAVFVLATTLLVAVVALLEIRKANQD